MSMLVDGEFFFQNQVMKYNGEYYVWQDGICWKHDVITNNQLVKAPIHDSRSPFASIDLTITLKEWAATKQVILTPDINESDALLAQQDLQNQYHYYKMIQQLNDAQRMEKGNFVEVVKSKIEKDIGIKGKIVGINPSFIQVSLWKTNRIFHPTQLKTCDFHLALEEYHCPLCSNVFKVDYRPCVPVELSYNQQQGNKTQTIAAKDIPIVCGICYDEVIGTDEKQQCNQLIKKFVEKETLWKLNQ